MNIFSVLVLTAGPPGQTHESAGAYVKIDGREALIRSVELFLNRDNIKQIQLVVANESAEEVKRKFGGNLGFMGVKLLTAGARWIEQIAAAVPKIAPEATHVLVHDAARPVVPYSDIDAILDAAGQSPAVALTAAVRASLIELDEGQNAVVFHNPTAFLQMLTPQVFSKAKFMEMAAAQKELHPSQWKLIKGSSLNVRVGTSADASMAKSMLNMLPKPKLKAPSSPFEEAQW
jgi:2-C-methyl-D-erythritol 4-phosphate cytidylyltransferase